MLLSSMLASAVLALSINAQAMSVAGVEVGDSIRVAEKPLKLNGAGIRYKAIFKVYVAALYLPEVRTTAADIETLPGEKRIELVMLRDISSESLSRAFLEGLKKNTPAAEQWQMMDQLLVVGNLFASKPDLQKGDIVTIDWLPKSGTVLSLNGTPLHDPIPNQHFYTALLNIWLGDNPPDRHLKQAMLGGDSVSDTASR
jgi:hypothetical protein